jgi:hypothetical protein
MESSLQEQYISPVSPLPETRPRSRVLRRRKGKGERGKRRRGEGT